MCFFGAKAVVSLGAIAFTLLHGSGQPLPMEQLHLHGVETFVNWPKEEKHIMVLFHGCNNQGSSWFQKPEEIIFLRQALSYKMALVAFTTPRHRGNFCWPSPDGSTEFADASALIRRAMMEVIHLKGTNSAISASSLILVGASSGGNFASRLPALWSDGLENMAKVAGFLSVISPTSFVRNAELIEAPAPDFPPSALVYMPKDKTFASEEAIATLLKSLHGAGVAAKAWPLVPQQLTAHDLSTRLEVAGISVEDESAKEFLEALADMELVAEGKVLENPRRVPWHRAAGLLDKDVPLKGERRQHRLQCVEEILNRAWAQHEFGMDSEVLQWLLSQVPGQATGPHSDL